MSDEISEYSLMQLHVALLQKEAETIIEGAAAAEAISIEKAENLWYEIERRDWTEIDTFREMPALSMVVDIKSAILEDLLDTDHGNYYLQVLRRYDGENYYHYLLDKKTLIVYVCTISVGFYSLMKAYDEAIDQLKKERVKLAKMCSAIERDRQGDNYPDQSTEKKKADEIDWICIIWALISVTLWLFYSYLGVGNLG